MSAAVRKNKYNVRDSFKLQRTEVESTNHCCVPHCSASGLYNSHLSFHRFPKNTSLRARWLHKIRRAGFSVTPHTKVCSRHFQDNEINTTAKGRRVFSSRLCSIVIRVEITTLRSHGPVFGNADLDRQVRNLTRRDLWRTSSIPS